jgi:hypothetical protein
VGRWRAGAQADPIESGGRSGGIRTHDSQSPSSRACMGERDSVRSTFSNISTNYNRP